MQCRHYLDKKHLIIFIFYRRFVKQMVRFFFFLIYVTRFVLEYFQDIFIVHTHTCITSLAIFSSILMKTIRYNQLARNRGKTLKIKIVKAIMKLKILFSRQTIMLRNFKTSTFLDLKLSIRRPQVHEPTFLIEYRRPLVTRMVYFCVVTGNFQIIFLFYLDE